MPQLKSANLRTPFTQKSSKALRARIDRMVSSQAVAASASDPHVTDLAGEVVAATVITGANRGVGESLTVDIQKNGVSILTAPLVLDNTLPGKTLRNLPVQPGTRFAVGDVVTFIRTYVAGGAPTPVGPSRIVLEIA